MDERDAQTIVRMVESGWSCDFGFQGRTLWCKMLYPYEAELVTQAVVEMSQSPLPGGRFKPHISDLHEIILSLRKRLETPRKEIPQERSTGAPEWYHVWHYARLLRDPKDTRSLPQQDGHVDPTTMMPASDYEKLRQEWKKAGSPKSGNILSGALQSDVVDPTD